VEKESKTLESKFFPTQAKKAYMGSGGLAPQIRCLHCRWKWSVSRFDYFIDGGTAHSRPTHCTGEWVGLRVGGFFREEKNTSPLPESESRIVQPIATALSWLQH